MKITNNGIDLLVGDDDSIGMIFANLTGVNLQGKELDDYIAWAKTQGLQSGTIAMVTDNGETIKTATIA